MAAILCLRLCFSTSVCLHFMLPVLNKLFQNLSIDEEEYFLHQTLELSLSLRCRFLFYYCRNELNTISFRMCGSVYVGFSENLHNVAYLSIYQVVDRLFRNVTVLKSVKSCHVLAKLSTFEVDPQTHERHLVFQIRSYHAKIFRK